MDPIKDAFTKVKLEILEIKEQIEEIKRTLQTIKQTNNQQIPQIQEQNPTIQHIPTDNLPQEGPISQYAEGSTGNRGVPTNRQTNQHSTQHLTQQSVKQSSKTDKTDKISQIKHLSQVLESLDSIKKEVRSTFKHLTSQEMTVFSTIYQLEEEGFTVDYSLISQKLSLSESSIRDYVIKIIKKGIPIVKTKQNNKKILLSVSPELRKIASLQTILALREL